MNNQNIDLKYINLTINNEVHKKFWPSDDKICLNVISKDLDKFIPFIEKLKNKNVVVQAGGNCGLYPFILSFFFKKVITFEPIFFLFHVLTLNCNRTNIYKFNCALSDEGGFTNMSNPQEINVGTFKLDSSSNNTTIIKTSLDSLNLEEVDFLMLDVEGHEMEVLKGAEQTISRCNPVVLVETSPDTHDRVIEYFKAKKYTIEHTFNPYVSSCNILLTPSNYKKKK